MKLLVTAKALRLDRTSEGICSSKFLVALARAGHDVTCLVSESLDGTASHPVASWLPGVRLVLLSHVTRGFRSTLPLAHLRRTQADSYGARKVNAASTYLTGYDCDAWDAIRRWREGIERVCEAERPDVIIARGAGTDLAPHIALSQTPSPRPWVAHYHDPYPISLFPDPYRFRFPLASRRQEAVHRRIVAEADALTFPCERLRRWVLTGDLAKHRDKGFVVPHVATDVPGVGSTSTAPWNAQEDFAIVHSGQMLRQRDPRALLRGFLTFLDGEGARARRARLVFVGRIDKAHESCPEWDELRKRGNLIKIERRVGYGEALAMARAAAADVVLEADSPESPVMVAKLADYLWLRRPILALSPQVSGTADILGHDYPLLVSPTDATGVAAAIRLLWAHWRRGTLSRLVPSDRVLQPSTEPAVERQMVAACRLALRSRLTSAA